MKKIFKLPKSAKVRLAAREREQSLQLIDTAIEQVMPHIREGELLRS
jgi:hypothetical protein